MASIDFEHVNFSYSGNKDHLSLKDISLHIPSGATVGILGGTGSAKSTLVNLIPRLYDVTDGKVCVGGHDVRDYNLEALRNEVCRRAAKERALLRHHQGQSPLGQRECHGRGDAPCLPPGTRPMSSFECLPDELRHLY